jgi:hypothetical protein
MESVCVCRNCGKTIDRNFIYCPWCGEEQTEAVNSRAFDAVFQKLEEHQNSDREKRLHRMEKKLDELEKDLNGFVLKMEIH